MRTILAGVAVVNLALQNAIDVGLMPLFGLPPAAARTAGSAALSGGHGTVLAGLALGATPTAVAIMTAATKAHGASPRSFLVVPRVGAFFVDIANAGVQQGFTVWLGSA